MYRAVEWYHPQYGELFDPNVYENTCIGARKPPIGRPGRPAWPKPRSSPLSRDRASSSNRCRRLSLLGIGAVTRLTKEDAEATQPEGRSGTY
jgi:hypothetical protein